MKADLEIKIKQIEIIFSNLQIEISNDCLIRKLFNYLFLQSFDLNDLITQSRLIFKHFYKNSFFKVL